MVQKAVRRIGEHPRSISVQTDEIDVAMTVVDDEAVFAASFGLEFSVDGLDMVVTDDGEIVVYDCGSERGSADGLASESGVEFTFEG